MKKILGFFVFLTIIGFSNSLFSQTHDLELIRINIPRNFTKTGLPLQPSIYIYNNGNSAENEFSIEVIIKNSENLEVYNSVEYFTNANFPAGSYLRPLFSEEWIAEEDGVYSLSATVYCEGDENPNNDNLQNSIYSEDLSVGFGWNAFDNIQPYGPAALYYNSTDACEIQSIIQNGNSDTFMAGADFIEDEWYAVQYSYNNSSKVYKIDPITGETFLMCGADEGFDGLAYDITTETVFVNKSNNIYTLNVETGVSNFIGTVSAAAGFVGIACDLEGVLYGLEGYVGNCGLFTIDKNTAQGTLVGYTGTSIMTAQDIAYDRNNDVLYGMLAGNQYNGLYNISTTTGFANEIQSYGNEISGAAIPYIPLKIDYMPQNNATEITADAEVWVMFHDQITANDLAAITISDNLGNPVQNITPTIIGSKLYIAHDNFESETEYTVTIPENSIKTGDFGNKEETWSFTTEDWSSIENYNNISVEVFPNPATEFVKISCNQEGIFSLCSVNGQKLVSGKLLETNNTIYLNELASGVYLLQMTFNNKVVTKKVFRK